MVNPWIIVPLYIYPFTNGWNTMFTNIAANPNLQFKIIVNPASGPGNAGSYPDTNYIKAIAKLNAYSNTQLLGYVDTAYATRTYSKAVADVDTYVNWSTYKAADIHMDGIFFDDNPSSEGTAPLTYMRNIVTYTRTKMSGAHISLNPGTRVSDRWYNIADSIVAFEDAASKFSAASLNAIPQSQRAKSIVIIHSYAGTSANQQAIVNQISAAQIPGTFISTVTAYNSFSNYFAKYCNYVASATLTTSVKSSGSIKVVKREDGLEKDLDKKAVIVARSKSPTRTHIIDGKRPLRTVKPSATTKTSATTSTRATALAKHKSTSTSTPSTKAMTTKSTKKPEGAVATAHAKWRPRSWGVDAQPIAVN